MLTDDYLIRMIAIAARALLRILGLIKTQSYDDAQQLIDLTISQLLGLNAGAVKNLADEQVYDLLTHNDRLDTERLGLLADLFEQEGHTFMAQKRPAEARIDYARSVRFNLVVLYAEPDKDQLDTRAKISALIPLLNLVELDSDLLWSLSSFQEEAGEIKKAEEALLLLVDRPEVGENFLPELAAFYARHRDISSR